MTAQQLNGELSRILKFDFDDLNDNRQGRMSFRQRARYITQIDNLLFLMLIVVGVPVMWVDLIINHELRVDQVLGGFAAIAITLFFTRSIFKEFSEVILGRVAEVSGTISIQVQPYDARQNFVAAALGDKWAYGIIEGISFHIPLEMETTFQGKKLTVYYTPQSRKVLAALVIE